jgi:peptidoglycan/xylan/chitin deacetylase (PgdA/CDA1 family)
MGRALILTYHAIEAEPGPLCVAPELFREQLDEIVDSSARVVTISQLADMLRARALDEPIVSITFDDGFASVAETAAPLLAERGLTATVFCVAGHLGGRNDWPSARRGGFEARLADGAAVAELAQQGFEIGSHGSRHEPLVQDDELIVRREVVESQLRLEQVAGASVRAFAYPYGAPPSSAAARLVAETYGAACTTVLGPVTVASEIHFLPRVDVHYVRQAKLFEKALSGSLDLYLRARGIGARARRVLRKDYAVSGGGSARMTGS